MQILSLVRCHGAVLVNLFESPEHCGHKVPGGHDHPWRSEAYTVVGCDQKRLQREKKPKNGTSKEGLMFIGHMGGRKRASG